MRCRFTLPAAIPAALLALMLGACASTPAYPPVPAGHYRVAPGDTLYRIALRHGRSVAQLSSWNRIRNPADLQAGQVLRVIPPPSYAGGSSSPARPTAPAPSKPSVPRPTPAAPRMQMDWPARGPLLARFSARSKGIDIAGKAGDAIKSAAAGKVVYAGQGIRSYGHLVIIKHNDNFLTAYAHNQRLLVREGETIGRGQTIAQMGSSGTDRVKLHFEVRFRGQAVDPLPYLN